MGGQHLNKGKQFEAQFKKCWEKSFPASFIYRLNDQMSGYKVSSRNICDFICFNEGILYLIECKSHEGNTFPIAKFTQLEKLKNKVGIPGVRTGVVLWMIDHKKVFYIPTATFLRLIEDGKKSFNVKMENDERYFSLLIPGVEKRMYIDSDYNILKNLEDGQ